jgi:hypothetical protein
MYTLTVLPNDFPFGEDRFPGWTEMTEWAWKNQDALIELAGERSRRKLTQEENRPLTSSPIRCRDSDWLHAGYSWRELRTCLPNQVAPLI